MGFPKGSEWRKWDLHVHSPLSILANQFPKTNKGEPDWDAYINRLEELDISVLGVTDYFTIDGYKKLTEFKASGRLGNIETILPNIEFRLDNLVPSRHDGEPKRINLHVIFSNELSIDDIEDHFLHELSFTGEGEPQAHAFNEKLKPSNLAMLGTKLLEENPPYFRGFTPLQVGATVAAVNFDDILKILRKDRFQDKYLIVLDEEYTDIIGWGNQGHAIRRKLVQSSDMIFSSNPNSIEFYLGLGKGYESPEQFIDEFKTLKPCIHGSDAHSLRDVGYPCANRGKQDHKCSKAPQDCEMRYCWIKADPTFDGLRQLLYEPEDRVKIQGENPRPSRHNYTLSGVDFSQSQINDDLTVVATHIDLHHGLVAVTGGKGAGKTAFVDLIAHCFVNRIKQGDENSFVKRISQDKPNLRVRLLFEKEETYEKEVVDSKTLDSIEIAYLSQGELEKYIVDYENLSKEINAIIFDSPAIYNSAIEYKYSSLNKDLDGITSRLQLLSQEVVNIEEKISLQKVESNISKRVKLKTDIEDTQRQIDEIQAVVDNQISQQAQEIQNGLSELKHKRDQYKKADDLLKEIQDFVDVEVSSFNVKITNMNELLKDLGLVETLEIIEYEMKELGKLRQSIPNEVPAIITKIEEANSQLQNLTNQAKQLTTILDRKRDLESQLEQAQREQADIEEAQNLLAQKREERKETYRNYLTTIYQIVGSYQSIIDKFAGSQNEILSDLEFSARIRFAEEDFLSTAEDTLHKGKIQVRPDGDKPSYLEKTLRLLTDFVSSGNYDLIAAIVEDIDSLSNSQELKNSLKPSKAIDMSDLYRWLYMSYFEVVPTIKYKGGSLAHLSLGQKATVLIKLYLAQGNKPIIIDSHDDHLDNQFIMDELIKGIRQVKKHRQIILVSNNGNVVVNSDAEQIIIAEREGTEISFRSGSLEDSAIHNKLLAVLEGGKEAFQNRGKKYRIL